MAQDQARTTNAIKMKIDKQEGTEPERGHRWFFFLSRSLEILFRGNEILFRGNEIRKKNTDVLSGARQEGDARCKMCKDGEETVAH